MHAQNFPLPLLQSIVAFLCFLITSSPSYGLEDKQYSTCNSSYTCGNIQNISFPFWGGDRPQECGLPQFKLACEDNQDPLIHIDGHNFRVLDINGDNQTMRIARNDLEDDICPDRFGNTSLNDAHFRYAPRNLMILILFYACPFDIPSQWKKFSFSCNNSGESNLGFYPDQSFISFWGPKFESCELNVAVPVLLSAFNRFQDQGSTKMLELVKQGFDVVYNKSPVCMACEKSGGLCWSETDYAEPTCLCQDRTYPYYCGFVGEQGVFHL